MLYLFKMDEGPDDNEPYSVEYCTKTGKVIAKGRRAGRELIMASLAKKTSQSYFSISNTASH